MADFKRLLMSVNLNDIKTGVQAWEAMCPNAALMQANFSSTVKFPIPSSIPLSAGSEGEVACYLGYKNGAMFIALIDSSKDIEVRYENSATSGILNDIIVADAISLAVLVPPSSNPAVTQKNQIQNLTFYDRRLELSNTVAFNSVMVSMGRGPLLFTMPKSIFNKAGSNTLYFGLSMKNVKGSTQLCFDLMLENINTSSETIYLNTCKPCPPLSYTGGQGLLDYAGISL